MAGLREAPNLLGLSMSMGWGAQLQAPFKVADCA